MKQEPQPLMLPPWPGDGSLEGDSPEPHVLWGAGPLCSYLAGSVASSAIFCLLREICKEQDVGCVPFPGGKESLLLLNLLEAVSLLCLLSS